MAKPVSETQSINPGSVIEMFELTTDAALHGSAATYRFHPGTNEINNGNIIWNGNTYMKVTFILFLLKSNISLLKEGHTHL